MRRWTVPVAAALLTVFVGCGTASADEKVNIQTELTPAAGEMPAAEFLPPENESLADRTEDGAPADTVSAGDGAVGDGMVGASEGAGMTGTDTVGDGAPGASEGAGMTGTDTVGDGMAGAGEGAGMTGAGVAGDGTPGEGASGANDGMPGVGAWGASEGTPETGTNETSGNTDGASSLDLPTMAGQVFDLINAQRSGAGLSVLEWDDNLETAAQIRAGELAVSFSHTRPDGSRGADITGVTPCGENLASTKGSLSTAENVVGKWTKSGAHSENILCADYTKAGVALYQASNGTVYWVVLFTGE